MVGGMLVEVVGIVLVNIQVTHKENERIGNCVVSAQDLYTSLGSCELLRWEYA